MLLIVRPSEYKPMERELPHVDNSDDSFVEFYPGDPKSRNDGTAEGRNGGMAEWRKMTRNPKRWNHGKSPEILKDGTAEWRNGGMAENDPKS